MYIVTVVPQEASDALLAHRAWDLALIRYLHTACRLHVAQPVDDWMLYWRVDPAAAHDPPPPAARRQRQLLGLLEAHCALTRDTRMDWQAVHAAAVGWGVDVDHAALERLWEEARGDLETLLHAPRGSTVK